MLIKMQSITDALIYEINSVQHRMFVEYLEAGSDWASSKH